MFLKNLQIDEMFSQPLHIEWTEDSLRAVFLCLLAYAMGIMIWLTITDELELDTIGEKKTALFAIIPDNDTSFNFLVSILYI